MTPEELHALAEAACIHTDNFGHYYAYLEDVERVLTVAEALEQAERTVLARVKEVCTCDACEALREAAKRIRFLKPSTNSSRSQVDAIGAPPVKSWDDHRRGCHATYNGGYEGKKAEAFHHGIDTVFNLLEAEFPPAELCKQPSTDLVCVPRELLREASHTLKHTKCIDEDATRCPACSIEAQFEGLLATAEGKP